MELERNNSIAVKKFNGLFSISRMINENDAENKKFQSNGKNKNRRE